MKTFQELARQASRALASAGVDEPGRESRMLLRSAAGLPPEKMAIATHEPASPLVEARMTDFVQRRCGREPIQYIVGEVHFYGRVFFVNRDVFIPRPETELLVDEVLRFTARRALSRLRIADACTGSGTVAITLAKELPEATVFAADIADLAIARRNAETHGAKIDMIQAPYLDGFSGRYEVITANPPYIPSADIIGLQPEIFYEPIKSLDGGEDGLSIVRKLLKALPSKVAAGGLALIEISPVHAQKAESAARESVPNASVSLLRDLSGLYRALRIELASSH